MNERKIELFGNVLQVIQVSSMIYALVVIILWIVKGRIWFQDYILPLHGIFFFAFIIITFLVLIPLMVIKTTRPYSGLALFQLTYMYGGITWFYAAYYCLYFIGMLWLFIGLLFVGLGVVPIAIIGAFLKGNWSFFAFLSVQLLATFGCRTLAMYAVKTSESDDI